MARSAALIAALFCPASAMSDGRLVGALWPKTDAAQKTNAQILLIFVTVISPHAYLEMKSHEDTQVRPRTSMRDEEIRF
jgi:hypothetical protein